MTQLLLEIFSEEIPARMQAGAAESLQKLVLDGLAKAGFDSVESRTFVTPRRLTLVLDGLPEATPDVSEERRGPRADAPEKALQGFLTANGVTLEQCEKRETPKGTFLFVTIEKKGRKTAEVLKEVIDGAFTAFPWPKSMRWADKPQRWVRPLHSILCLFGTEVVPVEYAGVSAGNTTRGHRFLAPAEFAVTGFDDYAAKLRDAFVIIDPAERMAMIDADARKLASDAGLTLKEDQGLLREVAGLVEWPVCLIGGIDDAFMEVPDEVLSTSMRSHQKYFSTLGADGRLANRFVVVSNMKSDDGGARITAGNERVLRARLSDAKFFWDQDRKARLESRVDRLKERIFHAKLGTDWDKVQRIRTLAVEIAGKIGADAAAVDRAALLSKADLSTGMVGEFPELQGIMGRYYARHDGEADAVAEAVAQHYSPLGPSDQCPTAPVSVCVALADKIDTLVGFWGIGEKPTGSKDPFALRRAALGVIRLVIENGLRLHLKEVMSAAFVLHLRTTVAEVEGDEIEKVPALADLLMDSPVRVVLEVSGLADRWRQADKLMANFEESPDVELPEHVLDMWNSIKLACGKPLVGSSVSDLTLARAARAISDDLLDFFADRLKVHLREQGVRHDLVSAVFALGGEDDLVRLLARVDALSKFLGSDEGANLLAAYRRAMNIVRIEEKKDGKSWNEPVDAGALAQDEEKALGQTLQGVTADAGKALAAEDFEAAMGALARLRAPVDAFFDRVTVNADDASLRANRLRLLAAIGTAMGGVADFGKVEG